MPSDMDSAEVAGRALASTASAPPSLDFAVLPPLETRTGPARDQIDTRLLIADIQSAGEYDAISYAWGSQDYKQEILCNGASLRITFNLYWALRRLRHPDRARILWADAICINQSDLSERSQQVAIMGTIYSGAGKVFASLGDGPAGEAAGVRGLVEEYGLIVGDQAPLNRSPDAALAGLQDDPRSGALVGLLDQDWFTRAGSARDRTCEGSWVLYGDEEVGYRQLMVVLRHLNHFFPHASSKLGIAPRAVHTDWLDWSEHWQRYARHPQYTFLDLLDHATLLSCTDPRDRIYAFLGHPLATLGGRERGIVPDYTKHPLDVYMDCTIYLLHQVGLRTFRPWSIPKVRYQTRSQAGLSAGISAGSSTTLMSIPRACIKHRGLVHFRCWPTWMAMSCT